MNEKHSSVQQYTPAIVASIVVIALTISVFTIHKSQFRRVVQTEFDHAAHDRVASIRRAISSNLLILSSVYTVVRANPDSAFRALAIPFESEIEGIQSLEWIMPVTDEQRESFEEARRREGLTGYQIMERKAQGVMVRAKRRDVYYPVVPLSSVEEGEASVGFDLGSEPARRQALELARDSGQTTTSARVTLVHEQQGENVGFLVFSPVYHTRTIPLTVQERRESLQGFVIGVYRISDIIRATIDIFDPKGLDFTLFDDSAPESERLLYHHLSRTRNDLVVNDEPQQGFTPENYTASFQVGGRTWSIVCSAAPRFMASRKDISSWLILITGFSLALLLMIYLVVTARHASRMRKEITERKQAEEALLFTQFAIDHSSDAAFWLGSDAHFTYVNDAACRSLGYSREELLGMSVHDIDPDYPRETWETHWQKLKQNSTHTIKTRHQKKDGTIFPVEITVSYLEYQGKEYHCTFARDITERKRAEENLLNIAKGVSAKTGEDFFISLVTYLGRTLCIDYAFIGQLIGGERGRIKSIAFYADGEIIDNFEYDLADTPCAAVIHHRICSIASGIQQMYPKDQLLKDMEIEGYAGTPLLDSEGRVLGIMVVLNRQPLADQEMVESVLQIFSVRAAAELERKQAQEALRFSEEKFAKAFRNSPDGIVISTLSDGRIIDISENIEKMTGYQRDNIIGQSTLGLGIWKNPEDRADMVKALQEQGVVHNMGADMYTSDHELRHFELSAEVINIGDEPCILANVRDITERKLVEEELKGMNLALANAMPGISKLDTLGCYVTVNEFYAKMLRYDPEELIGMNWELVVHPVDRPQALAAYEKMLHQGKGEFEARAICKDGSEFYKQVLMVRITDQQGEITGHHCFMRDITERKQAEDAMRQSEEKFRGLLASAPDAIVIVNTNGEIEIVNEQLKKMTGYTSEDLIGQPVEVLVPGRFKEHKQQIEDYLDMPLARQMGEGLELYCHHKDGDEIPVEISLGPLETVKGMLVSVSIRDITERKQAEEALRKSQGRLRKLATHLQAIREEERTLIAREIHDELGQTLTGLKMDLSWLREHMPGHLKKVSARIDAMTLLVDTKVEDTRKLAFRLRPAMLDDLGLEAAIECEVQDFTERAGYDYTLDLKNGNLSQDRNRDTAVFRILQEALTNVARHAKASQIDVALCTTNSHLILTVKDNGVGIDEDKIESSDSLGLLGMFERAGALGGQIKINKAKEGGTQLVLKIPLVTNTA